MSRSARRRRDRRVRWAELSRAERGVLLGLIAAECALTSAAAVDLAFRRRRDVRGGRALWWLLIFVQPVGPIAYLLLGRRRPAPANVRRRRARR
ncbi:MAG: PLDc N-terminal domain-containing protein [Actinomycetes bacterium]|nr:MAG: hypothetical protein DIU60_13850 [Actinomycetota bacterium]